MFKNEFDQIVGKPIENWYTREKPARKIFIGSFAILEPLDVAKHSRKLFDCLNIETAKTSWTYLPYGPFEAFTSWLQNTKAELDTELFVILDKHTQSPVGLCAFMRINPEHGVIEIGHVHFSDQLKKKPA